MSDEEIAMRSYLVRVLGLFEVNEGLDALLKAATTNREPAELPVRYQAIEEIARRAHSLSQHTPPDELDHPDLEPTLLQLAGDENPAIRHRTAFALGKLGTPAAIEKLAVLVDDPDADTRYNAAIALAHRGDVRSAATLAEMLDIRELAKDVEKSDGEDLGGKNTVILVGAIDAAHALARQNSAVDLSQVTSALDELAHTDAKTFDAARVPRRVASDAERVHAMLKAKQ
jgi:HEAT repeat protein